MRHDSQHGLTRFLLQKIDSRGQQRYIATEFVDDQTFDEGTLVFIEQLQRTDQRSQRTATIDIRNEQDRCLQILLPPAYSRYHSP